MGKETYNRNTSLLITSYLVATEYENHM